MHLGSVRDVLDVPTSLHGMAFLLHLDKGQVVFFIVGGTALCHLIYPILPFPIILTACRILSYNLISILLVSPPDVSFEGLDPCIRNRISLSDPKYHSLVAQALRSCRNSS